MSEQQWHIDGLEATRRLARALGEVATDGDVIGLVGDLGAGKTVFVQALAAGLGVPANVRVTSPTFTLINVYQGGRHTLHHADLYRIDVEAELDHIGLDDAMRTGGVVAVEWSDRFAVLPDDHVRVHLERVSPDGEGGEGAEDADSDGDACDDGHGSARRVRAIGVGPRGQALLADWARRLAAAAQR